MKGVFKPTPSHVEALPPEVETNWAKTKRLLAECVKHWSIEALSRSLLFEVEQSRRPVEGTSKPVPCHAEAPSTEAEPNLAETKFMMLEHVKQWFWQVPCILFILLFSFLVLLLMWVAPLVLQGLDNLAAWLLIDCVLLKKGVEEQCRQSDLTQ